MQEVHISKRVKLLDSPGIVAAASNPPASMALRSLQVEEGQESAQEAVRTLLKQCDSNQVRGVRVGNDIETLTLLLLKSWVQTKRETLKEGRFV